ncbi:DegT/DnrJ/EryC1/StrS family aminotransferase [Aliidiomarina quisquiliarum]|uniref:DegT/DnrJ/EryC1/StrS family aminotransferase n=1 Tax=Aliidiomarina quisquiliarum TaxID=2938947 RepID=UPI00208E6C9F|nr:DegT/DnrJ/EryC1/StrS family aminotransferase [Aliidiomarina quisquiliarum]MCO4319937.1 DegT/DnrJ/EryC1/StrS family aminotransferase [Aliidiomarina quisquiliarum]
MINKNNTPNMIPVSRPYLPERRKLDTYISGIYERAWLTNHGELAQELESRLCKFLGVKHLLLVANGTLAIQIALRALGVTERNIKPFPEVVTSPFTFIATASAPYWEGANVQFGDIDKKSWCISPDEISKVCTRNTQAILPVHVFGNPCDVEAIHDMATSKNLKVIYDASHAFGVNFEKRSVLHWGDASTLSFHATKLFHTIEGGAIVFKDKEALDRAKLLINFGISRPDEINGLGINAKLNEFQAAMGLCVLDEIELNLKNRARVHQCYMERLEGLVIFQAVESRVDQNYAYFPILLSTEREALEVASALRENGVSSRRYFYPSLDTVDYLESESHCLTSRDIASRILCLPMYAELENSVIERISNIVRAVILNCRN